MTSFAIRVFVVVYKKFSRICRVMSHIGAWHKQSLSLFSHFNFVFSLPFFDASRIFRLQNYSLCLRLCLFLFCFFCFVSMVFVSCFFLLLRPSFHSRCNDRVDVCFRSFWWNARLFGPCFQQSVAYRWRLFCPWLVSIQPHSLVSHLALLWWGVTFDIANKKLCLCLAYVVILFWKNDSYVTVSFSGCHWQCGAIILTEIGKRGFARTLRRQQQLFEDRGHFAEIVWFRKRSADTLKRYPGRARTLMVAGVTSMWVGATLCVGRSLQCLRWNERRRETWLEPAASLFVMRWCLFSSVPKDIEQMLHRGRRAGQWVEITRYNLLFAVFDIQRLQTVSFFGLQAHDRRRGVVFHSFFSCLLLVSLADCEVGAARRHLLRGWCRASAVGEKEWRCARRFGDCFFLDVVWKVVDNCSSCQACVPVVQKNASNCSCRGKRMIHSAMVAGIARDSPCRTRAQRMRLPSSIVSCSHKEQDLYPIVVRDSYAADNDAQGKQTWSATQPHARSKVCWKRFCALFV